MSRLSIFEPRTERFLLWLPIAGLLLIPLEYIFRFQLLDSEQRFSRFLSDFLLLGTIHSVTSFVMMAYLPECRAWMREVGRGSEARAWTRVLAVGATIFTLFFYARTPGAHLAVTTVYLVLTYVFGVRHWVMQTQGISFQYNNLILRHAGYGPAEEQRLRGLQRREKLIFSFLTYSTVLV